MFVSTHVHTYSTYMPEGVENKDFYIRLRLETDAMDRNTYACMYNPICLVIMYIRTWPKATLNMYVLLTYLRHLRTIGTTVQIARCAQDRDQLMCAINQECVMAMSKLLH